MTPNDRDALDRKLDRALEAIRRDTAADAVVDAAAARVRQRLDRHRSGAGEEPADGTLRTCADFRSLLPAYVDGTLLEARRLLLEDHSRECIPCRRALAAARGTGAAGPPTAATAVRRRPSASPWAWAAAAAVLAVAVLAGWSFLRETGGGVRIATVDGALYRVSDSGPAPLAAGAALSRGEAIRTAKASGAVVELFDGSRVEMNERSEIRVTRRGGGATVHLARGSIIVEASDQGSGHLFVRTSDCVVSVTGTVFSVNHGNRGSRVSVIEGEVHVDHGRARDVLLPGDQVTTAASLSAVPIAQEIAWSRNLDEHLALLKELAELRRELDESLDMPGVRHSTRLLDMAPEDTVIYLGLPNLAETLAEAHRLFREKVETSPALRRWWEHNVVASGAEPELTGAIDKIRRFGGQLGDEIVVAIAHRAGADATGPVILAELDSPGRFRRMLADEIDRVEATGGRAPLRLVDDPFSPIDSGDDLLLMVRGNVLVATPRPEELQHMASLVGTPGSGRFRGSAFHRRLAEAYADGVSIVFGADMETILRDQRAAGDSTTLDRLGLLDLRHLIVERHDAGDRTATRAVLDFGDTRRGIAAWLAEPAPMGALEFVSADATAAAAFVVNTPSDLLDELFGIIADANPGFADELGAFEREYGIDLVSDVAGPLGGEIALALDGPVLPRPSWKLIVEVYDREGLERTLEWVVRQANELARERGRAGLSLSRENVAGRTYHELRSEDLGLSVHYTYEDGYAVFAPQRALLDRALQHRRAGTTLPASGEFAALLPRDGRAHFSGILYHNLGPVMNPMLQNALARSAPLTAGQRAAVDDLAAEARPSLFWMYGERDRIVIGGSDRAGLLGADLGTGLHLGSILSVEQSVRDSAEALDEAGYDDR